MSCRHQSVVLTTECPVGGLMKTREVNRVLEHAVVTVVAVLINPVAAEACGSAVHHDTRMSGWPLRGIDAVHRLVRAAHFLATVPKIRRMVDPPWHHFPVDNPMDLPGGMQGVVLRAPRGRSVRRCACQGHQPIRTPGTIPRHAVLPKDWASVWEALLPGTGWSQAASSSEPPTSVGLACHLVGACRRHLMKPSQVTLSVRHFQQS